MLTFRKSTLHLLGVAALAAAAAQADDEFRVQAQLVYDKYELDEEALGDADTTSLSGTFFFDPVSTVGVPVGEAAYINRASFANVTFVQADAGDDVEADVMAASVGYHVPNTIFFGRVGVTRTDVEAGGFSDDDTSWNGTVGIVPIPRLFFGTDFTEDGYDPNLTVRYAGKLSNDHWWAGSVSAVEPDDDEGDSSVGVEFDYYFPSFKLGAGFNSGSDRISGRAEFGLPSGFALQGSLYTDDFGDGFALQLTWRDL
jgi:hypothetical protein